MEKINNEYHVSLEVAKLLKQAGFDWKCAHEFIDGDIITMLFAASNSEMSPEHYAIPTLSTAQRWLREEKEFEVFVIPIQSDNYQYRMIQFGPEYNGARKDYIEGHNEPYINYEEAQEAGIKKALEIVLEKGD